jgi:hypothetical protein
MTAVVITRTEPNAQPLSGAAYDSWILRGYRAVSAAVTRVLS